MSQKRCEKCRNWSPPDNSLDEPGQMGECRVGPPVVHEIDGCRGQWPLTMADDWCTAFDIRENNQPCTCTPTL